MAGSGLFALLDDITTLLDDIATMTKVAAVKTSGVTGDDLAVSAEQLGGIAAAREIPVVKAVALGSLRNKAILVPATLGISALSVVTGLPLIAPLLLAGGTFLCYEGAEKILHKANGHGKENHKKMLEAAMHGSLQEFEKDKIKGAIRTDLVLSGEIMILALGTMAAAPLLTQLLALTAVGIGMTAFVYGLVGAIVKLDDLGLYLTKIAGSSLPGKALHDLGRGILVSAPKMMKGLSIVGTAAMFMVGGGIMMHNLPMLAEMAHHLHGPLAIAVEIGVGLIAGSAALLVEKITPEPVKKAIGKAMTGAMKTIKGLLPRREKKLALPVAVPAPAETESSLKKKPDLAPIMSAAAAPPVSGAPKEAPRPTPPSPPSP